MEGESYSMNKYNIRKMLMTLGLSGTMVLVAGCSSKEGKIAPKQNVEKELSSTEPTTEPIATNSKDIAEKPMVTIAPKTVKKITKENKKIKKERPETEKAKKERLLREIEESRFDSLTKDILKSVVKESKEERTQEQLSVACREMEKGLRDLWLYDTIIEATREQKKIGKDYFSHYKLEEIKIFNNLDGDKKELPKDIEVMANISTYGNYKFYESIMGQGFLVTDQEDRVLLVANNDRVVKTKNYKLQSFASLLEKYSIEKAETYSSEKLLDEVLTTLSIQINDSTVGNLQSIKSSDIVVLDSSRLADSEAYENRYYFLKYRCPYLFDPKASRVYTDIFHPDANAVIGQSVTFYKASNKDHCMYDTFTPGNGINYFSLNDFLKSQGILVTGKISYKELKEIHKKVNNQGSKILKKTRSR